MISVKDKPLVGKKGLVLGIANEHSLAYGCAEAFRAKTPEKRKARHNSIRWFIVAYMSQGQGTFKRQGPSGGPEM